MPTHKTKHNGKVVLTVGEVSTLTGISSNEILYSASTERQSVRLCIRPPSECDIFSINARTLEWLNLPIEDPPQFETNKYLKNRQPILCQNIDLLVITDNECKRLRYFGSIDVSLFLHAITFDQLDIPRAFPIPNSSLQEQRYLALGGIENRNKESSISCPINLAKKTIKIDDLLVLVSDLSFVVDLEAITATDEKPSPNEMRELKTTNQESPTTKKANSNVTQENKKLFDQASCIYPKVTKEDLHKTATWHFFKKPHYSLNLVVLEEAAKEAWGKIYIDSEDYITNKEVARLIQKRYEAITRRKLPSKPATSMASLIRPDCGYGHPDSTYEKARAGRYNTNYFVILLEAADLFFGEESAGPRPTQRSIAEWLQTKRHFPKSLADLGARLISTKP